MLKPPENGTVTMLLSLCLIPSTQTLGLLSFPLVDLLPTPSFLWGNREWTSWRFFRKGGCAPWGCRKDTQTLCLPLTYSFFLLRGLWEINPPGPSYGEHMGVVP